MYDPKYMKKLAGLAYHNTFNDRNKERITRTIKKLEKDVMNYEDDPELFYKIYGNNKKRS